MLLSYLRTLVLYLILILSIRLMGKRQIGEMGPAEFVVTMLVANLASIPMQDSAIPLLSGLVPILTVLGMELVLSWLTLRSVLLRKFFCGKPVLLVENGRPDQDNLRRTRITLDELSGQLRKREILDISTVRYAILETDGTLSVIPFAACKPAAAKDAGLSPKDPAYPVTLVSDGHLFRENLSIARKDEAWVQKILKQKKASQKDTLLLTVDENEKILWIGKENRP